MRKPCTLPRLRLVRGVIGLVLLNSACALPSPERAAASGDGPGQLHLAHAASAAAVRNLPKSRIGNRSEYTVFGQRYAVLDSAEGFSESGVASWYGSKFHGRDTSSGEVYDMHAMTAAHKHLPLPTFVRVTRTDNGKSVVVKVNDRGPFVDDRIIDLSYGAAVRLGMLESGTAPVEIAALSTHHVTPDDVDLASVTPPPVAAVSGREVESAPATASGDGSASNWIQIGAYSDSDVASAELHRVARQLGVAGRVVRRPDDDLFRVRLGPLEAEIVESTLQGLASVGIESYTMVAGARLATVR